MNSHRISYVEMNEWLKFNFRFFYYLSSILLSVSLRKCSGRRLFYLFFLSLYISHAHTYFFHWTPVRVGELKVDDFFSLLLHLLYLLGHLLVVVCMKLMKCEHCYCCARRAFACLFFFCLLRMSVQRARANEPIVHVCVHSAHEVLYSFFV